MHFSLTPPLSMLLANRINYNSLIHTRQLNNLLSCEKTPFALQTTDTLKEMVQALQKKWGNFSKSLQVGNREREMVAGKDERETKAFMVK